MGEVAGTPPQTGDASGTGDTDRVGQSADSAPGAFDDRDLEAAVLLGQVGAEALTRIGWAKRSRAV